MPARDVAEREDRGQQAEPERERDDEQVRGRLRGDAQCADRRVPDREEQDRAEQLREIGAGVHGPSLCLRGRVWVAALRRLRRPWVTRYRAWTAPRESASASRHVRHSTSTSSRRSTAVAGSSPTATAPCRSRRTAFGERLRAFGEGRGDPSGEFVAPQRAQCRRRRVAAAGRPSRAARPGPVARRPASAPSRGRWAWAYGRDVRAGGIDGEVEREIRRRRRGPTPSVTLAVGVVEPDDDEVGGIELVLAAARRRHEQPVARRGGSRGCPRPPAMRPRWPEASSGGDERLRRACDVHPRIVPSRTGRRGRVAAAADRPGVRARDLARRRRPSTATPDAGAAGAAAAPRDQPLSENRDFTVLLTTQGISSLGDAVTFTALPLLVLALTGSGLAMGIVGALQTLAGLRLRRWSPGRSPTAATASG